MSGSDRVRANGPVIAVQVHDAEHPDAPSPDPRPSRRVELARRILGVRDPSFWIGLAVGAPIVLYAGLRFERAVGSHLPNAARWFVGGALLLDLVVVPLAAVVGWVGKKLLPTWAWPAVRAALVTTAVMAIYAYPLVEKRGGRPENTTLRPRDYHHGLAVALAVTWLAAAAVAVFTRYRDSHPTRTQPTPTPSRT
jgi:hypothetical protein